MEPQEDTLMTLEIGGIVRTLFGTLDRTKIEENNGNQRYLGNIKLFSPVVKVWEYVPGDRFNHQDLVQALEEAKATCPGTDGIIDTGKSSDSYWCESHEGGKSHWQPYKLEQE